MNIETPEQTEERVMALLTEQDKARAERHAQRLEAFDKLDAAFAEVFANLARPIAPESAK